MNQNYFEALEAYPNFPLAWQGYYEMNRGKHHKKGLEHIKENIIKKAIKMCPDHADTLQWAAEIYMRYEQWDAADELLIMSLNMRPECTRSYMLLATMYRNKADKEQDEKARDELHELASNTMRQVEHTAIGVMNDAVSWRFHDHSCRTTPEVEPISSGVQ